ncbi:MAG TPA: carboxymuconolactone decarboxylase family protein [Micropepsaceae bacterium]|nr:carboxymuconolactone decarboxylase family protein [Micropepsaceae bacterium]
MRNAVATFGLLGLLIGLPALAADSSPVSRLPKVPDPPTDPIVKEMWNATRARGGQILNLHYTMGNAPKIAKAEQDLTYALRFDAKSPRGFRELAIMRTGQRLNAPYEMHAHEPLLLACGYSRAQIEALPKWRESNLFNEKSRALLAYVDEVDDGGNVKDATFAAMKKFFTPEEILELTIVTVHYYGTALLTKSLQIKVEDDDRGAAPGKC